MPRFWDRSDVDDFCYLILLQDLNELLDGVRGMSYAEDGGLGFSRGFRNPGIFFFHIFQLTRNFRSVNGQRCIN